MKAKEKIVPKSQFKVKAFELFRYVEKTGKPLIISDHGIPKLKIIPLPDSEEQDLSYFRNTVIRYDSPLEPVGDKDWELFP